MNKKKGSIFEINIEQNQYIKPENKKQKLNNNNVVIKNISEVPTYKNEENQFKNYLNNEKGNNIETDDEENENNDKQKDWVINPPKVCDEKCRICFETNSTKKTQNYVYVHVKIAYTLNVLKDT